jgi:hypothetical protein
VNQEVYRFPGLKFNEQKLHLSSTLKHKPILQQMKHCRNLVSFPRTAIANTNVLSLMLALLAIYGVMVIIFDITHCCGFCVINPSYLVVYFKAIQIVHRDMTNRRVCAAQLGNYWNCLLVSTLRSAV